MLAGRSAFKRLQRLSRKDPVQKAISDGCDASEQSRWSSGDPGGGGGGGGGGHAGCSVSPCKACRHDHCSCERGVFNQVLLEIQKTGLGFPIYVSSFLMSL